MKIGDTEYRRDPNDGEWVMLVPGDQEPWELSDHHQQAIEEIERLTAIVNQSSVPQGGERVVCPEGLLEELRHFAAELRDRRKLEQLQYSLAEWERTGNAIMRHVCGREAPLSDADVIAEVDRLRAMLDAETSGRFQAVAEAQRLRAIVSYLLPFTQCSAEVCEEVMGKMEDSPQLQVIRRRLANIQAAISEAAEAARGGLRG